MDKLSKVNLQCLKRVFFVSNSPKSATLFWGKGIFESIILDRLLFAILKTRVCSLVFVKCLVSQIFNLNEFSHFNLYH